MLSVPQKPVKTINLITFIPVVICLIALIARLLPGQRIIDDSFITYRYARNLLSGNGIAFNAGEAVLGTTTPLYTLIMVAFGSISGGVNANFPLLSTLFNAFADAITCYLIILIGRSLKVTYAGYGTALVWAIAPYSVTFAIGGLETSLYVLLLTTAIWAYLTHRNKILAISAALAILTRPDAVLLLIPIALHWGLRLLQKKDRINIPEILLFFLPVIAWYVFAWINFGSPFPHSVQAKLVAYRLEPFSALIRLLQHYATPFLEHVLLGNRWIGIGLILYPVLFTIGARKALKTNAKILPWLLFPWLYLLAFSIPNPLIFRWYLTPPLLAYFFMILVGIESLFVQISAKWPRLIFQKALPILLIILLPLFSSLLSWQISPDHGPKYPAPTMAWFKLEQLYRQAAEIVAPELMPDAVLAAGDVGVLGYYTNARILDTVGLNSPQSLRYYPLDEQYYEINYAIAPDLIMDEKPEWAIFLEIYGRRGLLQDQRFLQEYTLVQKLETDIYGSDGMLIFRCNNCNRDQ